MKSKLVWEYKIWRPAMHPQWAEACEEIGQDMKRRDYWTQKWLNELGGEGWELMSTPGSPSNESYKWVFKRPVEKVTVPENPKPPSGPADA
jgi:hypothetical protein